MIAANELRIGNYVSYCQDDDISVVKGIYSDVDVLLNLARVFTKDLFGIPLTEDILLKCGFEKRVDNICNESHFVLGKFIVMDDFVLCDINIHVVITTLHHLQNLYFALTGEELNVEL